jgi:uncharacterized repeat protein (TIGR03803 family)
MREGRDLLKLAFEMSPRLCHPLIGLFLLWIALGTRATGEFTYERLAEFQPPVYSFNGLTLGSDGYVYTVTREGGGRILRIGADGRMETVVIFELNTQLDGNRSWLVKGPDGLLYGCASKRFSPYDHVIYRLTATGEIEVLGTGNFITAPVFGADGALYGCSGSAGISRFRSDGVFETVPGSEIVQPPYGALRVLVASGNGVIYFTTLDKLWKIGIDGVLSEVARFDAESPTAATLGVGLDANLAKGKSGTIYGMSHGGGPEDRGVIFRISPADSVEPIVAFGSEPGRLDGDSNSFNLTEGVGGNLYYLIKTPAGGRDVFAIKPDGTAVKIGMLPYPNGQSDADGVEPTVTGANNEVYAAYDIGNYTGKRTIFKISIETGCTIEGESPEPEFLSGERIQGPPIVGPDGGIWAISSASFGGGLFPHLMRLRPDGTFEEPELVSGNVLPFRNPTGLRALSDGSAVGVTWDAYFSSAIVFRAFADGSAAYVGKVGETRIAPVLFDDGSLVGSDSSSVYRIEPSGRQSRVVFSGIGGPGIPGGRPVGHLVRGGDGAWYGLTRVGGSGNNGTIYKVSAPFEGESVYQFGNSSSAQRPEYPDGSFIDGGNGSLCAVVREGGKYGFGGLIRYIPGGVVSLVTSFPERVVPAGYTELRQLTRGNNGWFYGVTNYKPRIPSDGTEDGMGFVFRVNGSGGFQVLGRFTGTSGALPGDDPSASLTVGANGALYGVTQAGGTHNLGTVFRVTPEGVVQHLASFSGKAGALPGASPTVSLVQRGNVLYGACSKGGYFNAGTLFRVDQSHRVSTVCVLSGIGSPTPGWEPNSLAIGEDGHIYGTGGMNTSEGPDEFLSPTIIHGTVFRLKVTDAAAPVDDVFEIPVTRVDVLANDGFDFASRAPKVVSVTQGNHGRVILNDDGTITYKPDSTFVSTDTFTYTAKLGSTVLGTAKVSIVDTRPPEVVSLAEHFALAVGDDATAVLPDYIKGTVVRDASGKITAEQSPPAGTILNVGEHLVTLTFTDVAGNTTTERFNVSAIDITPPVILTKPADRTFIRAAGDPQPLCPDLLPEVTATDNVGVVSITQSPLAGTPLPDGYTRFVISVDDAGVSRASTYEGSIHVVPPADAVGMSGDIAPGFEEELRYVSFGTPAIGADGALAFTAKIKSISGVTKSAVFRRPPGAPAVPIAVTGDSAGGTEVFTAFGEPLVNAAGTVVVEAKLKTANGKRIEGIWSAKVGEPGELLMKTGSPAPGVSNNAVIRDFRDITLLNSGEMFVRATIGVGSDAASQRALWRVKDGTWQLLLRTGDLLTLDGRPSAIHDLGFGAVPPFVGGQTRSFNASGQLVLRLTLEDQRSAIVRVSISDTNVIVDPLVSTGSAESDWLSLGIPAINDTGDIAFRGMLKSTDGNQTQGIGRVAAGQGAADLLVSYATPPGALIRLKLSDPIITPQGDVPLILRTPGYPELNFWRKNDPTGEDFQDLKRASSLVNDRIAENILQHVDSIAVSNTGIESIGRYRPEGPGAFLRGIIHTNGNGGNLLMQAEGDRPPIPADSSETIRRIDFLTPVLGVGGQTRNVNPSGQIAFRAKLSSGRTAIYVLSP